MPDPDPIPKLRVLDDEGSDKQPVVVLRLKPEAAAGPEPVLKISAMPAPAEQAERLESETREHFGGRSIEPGIEAILDPQAAAENIEKPWGGAETRVAGLPYGWFVLILLLGVGAGIWSVRAMRTGEVKAKQASEVAREKEQENVNDDLVARQLVDSVERTVKRYLAATSVAGILPLVRDPERVKPLIEETWKIRPPAPMKFRSLSLFRPETLEAKPFWVVQAEVDDGPLQSILLEQTGDTEVKVDWETHVCYQPISWDRYAKERPTGAMEFRVWAMRDVHFANEFSDSGRWRCFSLTTRDSEAVLYGYAQAGSEVAKTLETYCDGAPSHIATAILSLRVPEQSASPRGVVIEKIVEPRWVKVAARPAEAP